MLQRNLAPQDECTLALSRRSLILSRAAMQVQRPHDSVPRK